MIAPLVLQGCVCRTKPAAVWQEALRAEKSQHEDQGGDARDSCGHGFPQKAAGDICISQMFWWLSRGATFLEADCNELTPPWSGRRVCWSCMSSSTAIISWLFFGHWVEQICTQMRRERL